MCCLTQQKERKHTRHTMGLILSAIYSKDHSIKLIQYSFGVGFGIFLATFPCYRSKNSSFGLGTARRLINTIRLQILVEVLLLFYLFYDCHNLGSPVRKDFITSYNGGRESWLFGYGRPVTSLVLIFVGVVADMHTIFRLICGIGCICEMVLDALSAFEVWEYYLQVIRFNAPLAAYSQRTVLLYFYRDVISFGVCVWILLTLAYFSIVVGLLQPYISYQVISGGDLDRCASMRKQRDFKKVFQMALGEDTSVDKAQERQLRKLRDAQERNRNKKMNISDIENLQSGYGEQRVDKHLFQQDGGDHSPNDDVEVAN